MKKIAILLAVALVLCSANAHAQDRSQKTKPKPSAAPVKVVVNKTDKVMERNGMTLTYPHIDAPAYYKVPKAETGFSSGYCDNSFVIDWPLTLNGVPTTDIQQLLLSELSFGDWESPAVTVDELVKLKTECDFATDPQRVNRIPADGDNLSNVEKLTIYRLTPALVGFEDHYDIDMSDGTTGSRDYSFHYLNYSLLTQSVLKAEDAFKPELGHVLLKKLQSDDDSGWDLIESTFQENPHVPDNFKIDDNSITFIYDTYEIGPGAAGAFYVELALDEVAPFATPAMRKVLQLPDNAAAAIREKSGQPVYQSVDVMPQYPGGEAALSQYLGSHIQYPPTAAANNIQGKVVVQFVVTRTGRVGEVKVVRSVDKDLDAEAVRVVKSLPPRFIPGQLNGQPVSVWYTLPINFALQGGETLK